MSIKVTNFLGLFNYHNFTLTTTNLPLPKLELSIPSNLNYFASKILNIEVYGKMPICEGIDDLSDYLGYSIGSL